MKKSTVTLLLILFLSSIHLTCTKEQSTGLRFAISFTKEVSPDPIDGRLLLLIANNNQAEPRFQIGDGPKAQLVFGLDVDGMKPGKTVEMDKSVLGYPLSAISQIPSGEYWVQALINRYETFHRADGHVVKLPPDKGEGQHWNQKPGNLLSVPQKIKIDPVENKIIPIVMNKIIPPVPVPKDTKYIKHIKMKSKLLSDFWGRPIYLGAHVLLPEGFAEHPKAHYPLMIMHGHFPYTFGDFREEPPDPNLKPVYSERFHWKGYNKTVQEYDYRLYKDWTGANFPRVLAVEIQHANPYYDDSYAVNSENLGPYGDAITYELIPYIEKKFRGIGQGWARFLYGGSTGGWEALAVQIFYPDEYNGCFAACPDPIDFRAYSTVNIYQDDNAYYLSEDWKRTPRPGSRNYLGHVSATVEQMNHRELVLGSKSRSGDQWDIWEAVYSPVGKDGYPQRIWDKMTGKINHDVAKYWREQYDLRYILQRDWAKIGDKLKGKIHIYCGDMDSFYLNNAVYLMEKFLESTTNPYYAGEVDYGDRAEHCWNGDHTQPNAISRLRYHQMFIPRAVERMEKTAPKGADLSSWLY